MTKNTNTRTAPDAAAMQAARDYADAVVNETGYGMASVTAHAAVGAYMLDGLKRGDACETVATFYADALANLGKSAKVGGTKVGQLANAFDDAIDAGHGSNAIELMGAVYQARVGKIDGGVKTIAAALEASKGASEHEAVQAIRALPRVKAGSKDRALTLKQAETFLQKIVDAEWSKEDGIAVLRMLKDARAALAASDAPTE